jgi:DNA-binding MarR family transcriptional regulator
MNEYSDGLTSAILAAGKRMLMQLDLALESLGLSSAKLWALQAIALADGTVTVTYLAESMGTAKSNVTTMLDRLEADGLVKRTRSNEDRRTVEVQLTTAGQVQYETGMGVFNKVNDQLCQHFSAEEREQYCTFVQRVMSARFDV